MNFTFTLINSSSKGDRSGFGIYDSNGLVPADIQEFYEDTLLDGSKSVDQKTQETMDMATAWEKQSPMPYRDVNRKNAEKPEEVEKEPLPPTPPPVETSQLPEVAATATIEPVVEVR